MGWDPSAKTVIGVQFSYADIHKSITLPVDEEAAAEHPDALFHPNTGEKLREESHYLAFFNTPEDYWSAQGLSDMAWDLLT